MTTGYRTRPIAEGDIPQMPELFRSTELNVNSKDYTMNTGGYLHSMFVHKDWQGKGVASRLLMEAEKMVQRYGVPRICAEASITARPFFEKHGYNVVKEQKAKARRLWLTNYAMEKILQA